MPKRLYKPTIFARATVVQEARIFLEPEENAPLGSWRVVQLLVPASDLVYVIPDVDPKQLGLSGREYQMTPVTAGIPITFPLMPHQFLTGSTPNGLKEMSMIVSYFVHEVG